MMFSVEKLKEIILFHRKKSGLSRHELAHLAGVGKTVIYDIEHGKITIRLDTLTNILEVLNISLNFESSYMEECERNFHEKG